MENVTFKIKDASKFREIILGCTVFILLMKSRFCVKGAALLC